MQSNHLKPWFGAIKEGDEYVLLLHHPNGSYAGIGALNGSIEALLICNTLNEAITFDPHVKARWLDYFEKGTEV